MKKNTKPKKRRITSYDFFKGISISAILLEMVFVHLEKYESYLHFFHWAEIGIMFFFGIILGEILLSKKNNIFFMRRGIQILGLFIFLNLIFSWITTQKISLFFPLDTPFFQILLPLSFLFFFIPVFRFFPAVLGIVWCSFSFTLIDILYFSYENIFIMLLSGGLGFFIGKNISLDKVRENLHRSRKRLILMVLQIILFSFFILELTEFDSFLYFSSLSSFHLLLMMMIFFALPNSIFLLPKSQSLSRRFFETLGIEVLFAYIIGSSIIYLAMSIPGFQFEKPILSFLFSMQLTIFIFSMIHLINKISQGNKSVKKIFRAIF